MSTFVPRYLGEFSSNEIVLKPWDWNTIVLESCQILLEEIESMTSGSETNPQMPGGKMVNLYSRFSFASSRYPPDRMEGLFCLVAEAIHYINFVLRTIKSSPNPVADKFSIITQWTDKFLKNRMRGPIESGIFKLSSNGDYPRTSDEFRRNVQLWLRWLDIASQLDKNLDEKEMAAFVGGIEFVLRLCVACGSRK